MKSPDPRLEKRGVPLEPFPLVLERPHAIPERDRIERVPLRAPPFRFRARGVELRVTGEQIEPPSALVTTADSAFLRGVARLDERLILLLDLAHILSGYEQDELAA